MNVHVDAFRALPANLDVERAVLGALMMYPDALPVVVARIGPEHFVEQTHAMVFDVLAKLAKDGKPLSPMAAATYLPAEIAGQPAVRFLVGLTNDCALPVVVAAYADMLADLHARRAVIAAAEEAIEMAHNPPVDLPVARIVEDAVGAFRSVGDLTPGQTNGESVDDTFGALIEAAQDRLAGKAPAVPSTGFLDIDAKLSGGLLPGRLIVLAGRPGMGKTVLMVAMARRAAEAGAGVGVFSLEIDRKELTARLVANVLASGDHPLSYSAILNGALNEVEITRLCQARQSMRSTPLEVSETGGLTMAQIETRALQMARRLAKAGRRLDVVLIDYLQLVSVSDRYKGRPVEELGEVALHAKNLAKRLGVCVVLLSQLNRSVESRDNKRPVMSDLRGSGNIEEHADAVGLLYRPEYYDQDDPKVIDGDPAACLTALNRRNQLEVHWAKNRLGPTETTRLFCDVSRSQVENHSSVGEGRR